MDFECIIVLADDLKQEELVKTHEITTAISSLEPEIKMALINSTKGDDYDLEEFYNKAKGFIEVVIADLDSFKWSKEHEEAYQSSKQENEGVLRILEALENCVWKDRKEVKIEEAEEKQEDKESSEEKKEVQVQVKEVKELTEDQKIEKEMDDLGSIMQQMMAFKSNRDNLSDTDRKKQAAELVLKLASGLGEDEKDLADMFTQLGALK